MIGRFDTCVTTKRVLCGGCALNIVGLVNWNSEYLILTTDDENFDNFSLFYMEYWYYANIDYSFCVKPSEDNPLILIPTKERAIVDYLRNEKHCDEGILIEALKTYLLWFKNLDELYRVCEHFDVSRDLIDYWIYEAEHDEEI